MIKKIFLSIIGIAAVLQCKAAPVLPELTEPGDADAWGYVHDGEKGIADVLVTDGFDFVRTDATGAWRMKTDPAAEFVYVVLPSGYEHTVVENGVVKYFSVIDRSNGMFRADFALNPIGDDTSFSFMVHADTQPEEYYNKDVYSELRKAYTDMAQTASALNITDGFQPFNLHMGDIVYNTVQNVRDYKSFLSALQTADYNVPIFATPGNHDRRYNTDVDLATKMYREVWGPLYHSFNRGNIHFISVDNVVVKKNDEYTRGIRPEEVAWLKKDLSYLEKGSKVVFFTHQPMTRSKAALKAYSEVLDILKDYDVLILTGHLHRIFNNFPEYAPSIKERNQTGLGGDVWRTICSKDGVPRGYYIYHFDGNELSWKFKPLGKDADKNMFRVYEPGFPDADLVKPSDNKTVVVNVWDWDENWKVTWSLDGVDQGDVPRYENAKDPLAVYNFEGIPGDDIEIPETYHIFHCDVPPTGSLVKVTVSDPFGRTLSKTLELASVPGGIEAVAPESCGVEKVEIYNLQGVRLLEVSGYPETDTLPLGAGCYVMRVYRTDGTVSVEKFVP